MYYSNSKIASKSMYLDAMIEPSTSGESNGIYIGRTATYRLPFFLDLDTLINKNMTIIGMSGSGKSYLLKSFVIRSNLQRGSSILIVDWNSEYKDVVEFLGGKTLTLGLNFRINIFDLYELSVTRNIRSISSIISHSIDLDRDEDYRLYSTILLLGSKKEVRKVNLESIICKLKKEKDAKSRRLANKLMQLVGNPLFSNRTSFNMNSIMNSVISIDFSMLRDDTQRTEISSIVFRAITELMHRTKLVVKDKSTERIIVLDEAWRLIKNSEDVGVLFREGRKYGVGIIAATQLANDVDNEVLSNSACRILFRLQNENDYETLINSGIISEEYRDKIMTLPVGSCMICLAMASNNRVVSNFFIRSTSGVITRTYVIGGDGTQNRVSYKSFVKATKGLLVSETVKEKIMGFMSSNDNKVDCKQFVKFLSVLGIKRHEVVWYLRTLGVKDRDIIWAYNSASLNNSYG